MVPWYSMTHYKPITYLKELASRLAILLILSISWFTVGAQQTRSVLSLDKGWRTMAHDNDPKAYDGFEQHRFRDEKWKQVDVPHNWDGYEGFRRNRHGNRHGYAWYRKNFAAINPVPGKRYFLFFEGVGSYATVWLNGKKAG